MHFKKSLILTAILCPVLAAGVAFAQDPPERPEPPSVDEVVGKKVEALQSALNLTPEQTASFTELLTNSITEERDIQTQIRALHEQIRELKQTTRENFGVILTDEQEEQLKSDRRLRGVLGGERASRGGQKGQMRGGRKGRGNGPDGGHGFEGRGGQRGAGRIMQALELTEEQRTQLHELRAEGDLDMHEALEQVLTPEQQEKLEELRANRPERPERPEGAERPERPQRRGRRSE